VAGQEAATSAQGQGQDRGQGGARAAATAGEGVSKGQGRRSQGSTPEGSARGRLSLEEGAARVAALRAEVAALQRHLVLASAMEGPEGFQVRWRLHGEAKDIEERAAALETHLAQRKGQGVVRRRVRNGSGSSDGGALYGEAREI